MMSPTLIVVDDEPEFCDFVRETAEHIGFDVSVAHSATEFHTAMDVGEEPDSIVLDLVMPDTDGFELLQDLAAQGSGARLVLVSGFDDRYLEAAATFASAKGLNLTCQLRKPIRHADLVDALS